MEFKQEGGIVYYSLPKGTILYRGDSNPDIGDKLELENRLTFFGFDQGNVEENYGVAYKFSTNKVLNLIALDKNHETDFLDIVEKRCKNNEEYEEYETIKRILDRNYGYRNGIRDSVSDKDKIISEFICNNFPEYHGYACENMKTDFGGTFHSESMICRPKEHLVGGERVTPHDKIKRMREEYEERMKKLKTRKKNSRFDEDESSYPRPGIRLFDMDRPSSPGAGLFGMETPPPSPGRRLFGGKRKTKKRNSKKQKSKKRKQSLRK
jgi:hypothetical protein